MAGNSRSPPPQYTHFILCTEWVTRSDRPAILEAPISMKAEVKEQIHLFLSQTYSEAALAGETVAEPSLL